jgi:hypothetical protein
LAFTTHNADTERNNAEPAGDAPAPSSL